MIHKTLTSCGATKKITFCGFRLLVACVTVLVTGGLGLRPAAAATTLEDFEDYPIQSDTTGIFDAVEGETIFRITTTGGTGASDPIVGEVSEQLAASAGIAAAGGNQFWTFGSSAGATETVDPFNGVVLGIGMPTFLTPKGGPFAAFFSSPQDITSVTVSVQVRETTEAAPTQVRFLAEDTGDREIVTGLFTLTNAFQTFTVDDTDFTTRLDATPGPFDSTQVTFVGLQFFTTPGTAPAFSFDVDNVQIASTDRFANLSTRGVVQTADNVMIGGFIIEGTKTVLVRARGPILVDFGVPGVLANPFLQLFDGSGTEIADNDDWETTTTLCQNSGLNCGDAAAITATGLDPCVGNLTGCTREAALLVTLPPGNYTAQVSGVGGGTGVGLVEVFEVNP